MLPYPTDARRRGNGRLDRFWFECADAWYWPAKLGWLFAPIAWLIGIPWAEAGTCGALLGTKLVLNELVAYIQLAGEPSLSPSTRLVMTYALCGFANFGSLGILLGGMGALIPERRVELLELAPKTLVSGTLVTCATGAVAALVTSF